MSELLPNTDLSHPLVPDPSPEESGTTLLSEDAAIRLNTDDTLNQQFFSGQLEAYRGEYIVAGPDGTVLGHHARLKQAKAVAAAEAAARGIPLGQLTHYYVPTPD